MMKELEEFILEFARREVKKALDEDKKYYRKSKWHPDNLRLGNKNLDMDAHKSKQEHEMALLKSQVTAVLQAIEEYPPPEVLVTDPKTKRQEQVPDTKSKQLAVETAAKVLKGITTPKKNIHALAVYIVALGIFPRVPFTSLVRALVEIFEKR
jgi:hypothetical protein